MNNQSVWFINCLLVVVVVLLGVMLVGDKSNTARASGGGAELDQYMITVLTGNTSGDRLCVIQNLGSTLRVHIYEVDGADHTMQLLQVRELDHDFALPPSQAPIILKGRKGQTYEGVKAFVAKLLKQGGSGRGRRGR